MYASGCIKVYEEEERQRSRQRSPPFSVDKSAKWQHLTWASRTSAQHRDWHRAKKSPMKQHTEALRPVRGKSGSRKVLATSPACVVRSPPRPIPSRASWEKGDGKDLASGGGTGRSSQQEGRRVRGLLSAFHPCSSPAQLEGTAPSPAAGGTEQGAALGFFLWFVCLVLLGVEQRWKKVRFPVPLPKM